MKLSSGYEERKARLEMLPLMDVMFLILVFFVYSIFSMTVHRGIKVDLPTAVGEARPGEQNIITITSIGTLAFNKKPLSFDEVVATTLKEWSTSGRAVLISADRTAPVGIGIELLDRLRRGGVEQVAFQVSGDTPPPAPAVLF